MSVPRTSFHYRPPHLALDVWRPKGDPLGLVVHAHGGGFVHGSRDDRIARHFGPFMAEKGLTFASISYRKGGAPQRAFDPDMLGRIKFAVDRSIAFYPNVRPSLFGPALYRCAVDFADAASFLRADHELCLSDKPWVAIGNSSGGLAAISVAHGLSDWTRPADLPAPTKCIAIASIVPQPWSLSKDGPSIAMLCARGDEVFPRSDLNRLTDHVVENELPVQIHQIPHGMHTRPIKEILPRKDQVEPSWHQWFTTEICTEFGISAD